MRRIHVSRVAPGPVILDQGPAHHVRDVLRLGEGDEVEVFDDAGAVGHGEIARCTAGEVVVEVRSVAQQEEPPLQWTVAAAVPKGQRADWMVEKLSELGTAIFVPLASGRSVVHPEGKGKQQRWERLAAEAARQSRRAGVMRIGNLASVGEFLKQLSGPGWYFSTDAAAVSVPAAIDGLLQRHGRGPLVLSVLIGPEGGWTDDELGEFAQSGLTGVSLGRTILRVETAAVAAAAVLASVLSPRLGSPDQQRIQP